ncbi:hypothetical protein TD95_003785 [Thielaviopsis punctulata]|uniref:non-specific serine/threonine protein kinase n=1 Tax=Thielaviopsis punctulata TaxID=72032 RepID=A0A0F4ZJ99_9PEZI|nr:hypothetical protein TD95_003785 [Thielaviopsis punctulata]
MEGSQLSIPLKSPPFRIISKTIGRGAYASIKKAIPLETNSPVFAVKLIHKEYALSRGRVSRAQLNQEVGLHEFVGVHPNVIEFFASKEDATWRWIAMELAEGGDLFDKIEADVGVEPDIAQLYFRELIAGVSFMHSKGVAHRDLKPENILMSKDGALKIADFGMATMFRHNGQTKQSTSVCGSPPYVAPEILEYYPKDAPDVELRGKKIPYDPEAADIWSCGVILFVLLVGNTPWDEPTKKSWEFSEYKKTGGHSSDPLWSRVPSDALSLLRGMMCIKPADRFNMNKVRQHPWFTRHNPLLTADGTVADPLHLATQLLANLRIDLKELASVSPSQLEGVRLISSQPDAAAPVLDFDWERPSLRSMALVPVSATQPSIGTKSSKPGDAFGTPAAQNSTQRAGRAPAAAFSRTNLVNEPLMTQFSQATQLPISLTQAARRFRDIIPAETLARFFSHVPQQHLVNILVNGLHELNVAHPTPKINPDLDADLVAIISVRTVDGRRQTMYGHINISRLQYDDGTELLEVNFIKTKGDPLEWRRFFKKMAVLSRDAIYVPEEE